MRLLFLYRALAVALIIVVCMLPGGCRSAQTDMQPPADVVIASYNVHNLFDACENGGEYEEYRPSKSGWDQAGYRKRLDLTAKALRLASAGRAPDILCLQEIENAQVLADLARAMRSDGYRYWAAGGPEDAAVHVGVLSRFPIVGIRAHAVRDAWGFKGLRDMIEVEVNLPHPGSRSSTLGTSSGSSLLLFVCHWKSKREGEKETEPARRAAAALLRDRLTIVQRERPDLPIIVCGDFNESPDEYLRTGKSYPTAFMPHGLASMPKAPEGPPLLVASEYVMRALAMQSQVDPPPVLYSPWVEMPQSFSIAYRDRREQFDGFFLNRALFDEKSLEYASFMVCSEPPLVDDHGMPRAWDGRDGFSDHLPVLLYLAYHQTSGSESLR
ncbi:MAG: endonuclease/exonuclease/phosphatase family protein [Rectinemataceae bacterium]|nr:endonuclease/exonuclease/phosphatase family protein [Spirochaetaceae bacterium]